MRGISIPGGCATAVRANLFSRDGSQPIPEGGKAKLSVRKMKERQRKTDIKRTLEPLKISDSIPDAHYASLYTESKPAAA